MKKLSELKCWDYDQDNCGYGWNMGTVAEEIDEWARESIIALRKQHKEGYGSEYNETNCPIDICEICPVIIWIKENILEEE